MAVVRRLTEVEMKEAIRLSDATFRDAEQPSMGSAFPYIFSESSVHLSFGAFEDGKLISFMGLVPWEIRIGEAKLRVFSLGSVCTDPEARGKGYASEILREINEYTRRAGASLLLVSGYRSLYTRTGCAPFGRVRRYGWDSRIAQERMGTKSEVTQVREMSPDDLFVLQELAASRDVRYHLGVHELATLLKAEALASCIKMNHRVLVAEKGDALSAFAVIGVPKNQQKRGVVLEYAGAPDAVVRLAGEAVLRYGLTGLDLPVPWHESELHAALEGVPSAQEDHLGTVRIVDGEALISQLRPWLEKRGETGSLRLEPSEDGQWLLERAGGPIVSLTAKEWVRLIFDCASAENEPLPAGADAYRDLFPVPFPYTAGLCYI